MLQKIKTAIKGRTSWVERHFEVLLVCVALVAMAISLTIGLHQSVWFDEAYSILLSRESVDQLLYLTSLDTHPPLYYLMLKAWAGLFGYGETALRILSVVCMGGALIMAGLLLRRMFTARVALIALPFIAFAPMLLRYGFEIRGYAMASLIGIAATYVLVVALQAKRRNQWLLYTLYAILITAGVLTLYYMALLWVAHAVWLIWRARREKQPIIRSPWFAALLGGVLLFIPWLPVFATQLTNNALAPVTQALTLDNMVSIISFMFVYQPSWQLSMFMSLVVLAIIIGMTVLLTRVVRLTDKKHRRYLLLLGLYVLVPIAVLALVSLARPMYIERYLSHVLIGGYMLVGVAIGLLELHAPSRKALLAGGGVLAVLLVGVLHLNTVGNYNFQRLQTPAVKQAAASITNCGPDQTILAADPYVAIELSYYLPNCEVRFYSESAQLVGGYAPLSDNPLHVANPESELADSHELLYIYYDKPQLTMPETLNATSRQTFGQLTVAAFHAQGEAQ